MAGFEFRYRLGGAPPTTRKLDVSANGALGVGDMLNRAGGGLALGVTGDKALVGAAVDTVRGAASNGSIRVITDADAVYGVEDPNARTKEATLDLSGVTGAQGVTATVNGDFTVVMSCTAEEETLVRIRTGSHHQVSERLVGGELNAAVARACVRYHREYLGRGPRKAHAFHRGNAIVVVMEEGMTKAQRTLADAGEDDAVLAQRDALQRVMRDDLIATVEELTGCKVEAFVSANHLDPDLTVEFFYLDRWLDAAPDAPSPTTDAA